LLVIITELIFTCADIWPSGLVATLPVSIVCGVSPV